jgi:hypothetical protein
MFWARPALVTFQSTRGHTRHTHALCSYQVNRQGISPTRQSVRELSDNWEDCSDFSRGGVCQCSTQDWFAHFPRRDVCTRTAFDQGAADKRATCRRAMHASCVKRNTTSETKHMRRYTHEWIQATYMKLFGISDSCVRYVYSRACTQATHSLTHSLTLSFCALVCICVCSCCLIYGAFWSRRNRVCHIDADMQSRMSYRCRHAIAYVI